MAIIANLGARLKEKQVREGREVYVIEIEAGHLKALVEKLKALGDLKRSTVSPDGDSGRVEVRVEFVF